MATRLIRQPDGTFGLYSTISDSIWAINCDKQEIIKIWVDRAIEKAEKEMKEWIDNEDGEEIELHHALSNHFLVNDCDKEDEFTQALLELLENSCKSIAPSGENLLKD